MRRGNLWLHSKWDEGSISQKTVVAAGHWYCHLRQMQVTVPGGGANLRRDFQCVLIP